MKERVIIRLFTFQDEIVADLLLKNKFYKAKVARSRHSKLNDYSADIAQLGGNYPIWTLMLPEECTELELITGKIIENNSSVLQDGREFFANKVYLELEVEDWLPQTAIAKNSSKYIKVIPYIDIDMVVAIYRINISEVDGKPVWELDSSKFTVNSVYEQSYPNGLRPMSISDYKGSIKASDYRALTRSSIFG